MALGGTDLNLLLPLKVLLEEGNVTRAGQRLELSQPAMSAALARLRRRFDDELLVRAGRDYELTPFARDLLPEVQHARAADGRARCTSRTSSTRRPAARTFRMAMSDYAIAVVHEPLVRLMRRTAPGVRLTHREPRPRRPRSSDRVLLDHDALIAPLGFGFPGESRPLWRDRMVLIADRGNPRLVDGSAHAWRTSPSCRTPCRSFGPGHPDAGRPGLRRARHRAPDRAAGRRASCRCRSSSRAPTWSRVVPERLARIHPAPDGPAGAWSSRRSTRWCWPRATGSPRDRLSDPAHRWLFDRLDELAAELAGRRPDAHSQWLRFAAPSGPAR